MADEKINFDDVSKALSISLANLAKRKVSLDEASKKLEVESAAYTDAFNEATNLRQQLAKSLDQVIPTSDRVRQSG